MSQNEHWRDEQVQKSQEAQSEDEHTESQGDDQAGDIQPQTSSAPGTNIHGFQVVPGSSTKVICPVCFGRFHQNAMRHHMQRRHDSEYRNYFGIDPPARARCATCGRTFVRQTQVAAHMSQDHDVDDPAKLTAFNYMKRKKYPHLLNHYLREAPVVNARKTQSTAAQAEPGEGLTALWPVTDPTETPAGLAAIAAAMATGEGRANARKAYLARQLVAMRVDAQGLQSDE